MKGPALTVVRGGLLLAWVLSWLMLATLSFQLLTGVQTLPMYYKVLVELEEGASRITGPAGPATLGLMEGGLRLEHPSSPWARRTALLGLPFAAGFLLIVFQPRRIVASLVDGEAFADGTAGRLRAMALVVFAIEAARMPLAFLAVGPFLQQLQPEGLQLFVDWTPDLSWIFWGCVILVLAEIFARGAELRREAELTV
ncbi:MAG: DUF2975 domain-containing protein [Acidobacteriota bacterium]